MKRGQAKGTIVPERFSPEDSKRVEAAAKASNQTVSPLVRSVLAIAINVRSSEIAQ
jgi:hypothetical protein